jgi:hypothetical protein
VQPNDAADYAALAEGVEAYVDAGARKLRRRPGAEVALAWFTEE